MGNNTGLAVVIIAAIAVGYFAYSGGLNSLNLGSTFPTSAPTTSLQTSCGDDAQADLDYRYRNMNNVTAADYHSGTGSQTLTLIDDSTSSIIGAVTNTYNVDGSYDTSANLLSCGKTYRLGIINSAAEVAAMSAPFTANSDTVQVELQGAQSSEVNFNLYTVAYANDSNSGPNGQDFATSTNHDIGAGATQDVRYDVAAATASAQFGAKERLCETSTSVCGRAFVCITGAPAVYQPDGLAIAGGPVIGRTSSLPSLCQITSPSNAGVGRAAFEINAIKNSDGRLSGTVSVTAATAPADTNNVQYLWMDNSYYAGNDNTAKIGTANDVGTDTGETNRYFEIDLQ